jgi:hypothetical protein
MPIVESATSYTSSVRFLGLPLVHIARGSRFGGPRSRGVAIGWIAIGDVAFGLVAIGGVAIGVIGIGGAAVGAVSIGGLALGVASMGGVGVARHMNDSSATAYLDTQMFFRVASWLMYHSITLAFLPMMVMFLLVLARILRGKSSS